MTKTLHKIAILPRHPILVIVILSISKKSQAATSPFENKKSGDCDA